MEADADLEEVGEADAVEHAVAGMDVGDVVTAGLKTREEDVETEEEAM